MDQTELRRIKREQLVINIGLVSSAFFLASFIMGAWIKREQIIVQHRYICITQAEKLSYGEGMLWCDEQARVYGIRFDNGERVPIPEEFLD